MRDIGDPYMFSEGRWKETNLKGIKEMETIGLGALLNVGSLR